VQSRFRSRRGVDQIVLWRNGLIDEAMTGEFNRKVINLSEELSFRPVRNCDNGFSSG
jgi:hypothetical protein